MLNKQAGHSPRLTPNQKRHQRQRQEAMKNASFWRGARMMAKAWKENDRYWMSYALGLMRKNADDSTDEIYCQWSDKYHARYK